MNALRDRFLTDLDAMGLPRFDAPVIERLLEYATLLQRWNARIRLVGPSDLDTIVREQLLDALGFVLAVRDLDIPAFWDVGAGGGLPGIPLAIVFPDRDFVLIEPIGKKTAFLAHAATALSLPNVLIHTGRVEPDGAIVPPLRRAPRTEPRGALSRATLGPSEWLGTARALVGPGATVLLAIADARSLPEAIAADPSSRPAGSWTWTVPATGAPRTLLARFIL